MLYYIFIGRNGQGEFIMEKFLQSQLYKRKSPNLIKLGFDFNNDILIEYNNIKAKLEKEYIKNKGSMLTLKKKYDIPSTKTISTLFNLFDIKSRSFGEATSNAIYQKRKDVVTSKFQHIYHTTWDGELVYLRSSHELDFAKYLDNLKIKYLVEHLRIEYYDSTHKKLRIAIPDFYIPSTNTIIEVKSTYWLNIQNMEDKVKEYKKLKYNFQIYLDHELKESIH